MLWNLIEDTIGQNVRIGNQFWIIIDQVGKATVRQDLHREDFLYRVLEPHEGNGLSATNVDCPHAAAAFGDRSLA